MIRSNQAGQAKNRPPRREEGENGNLQRFPKDCLDKQRVIFVAILPLIGSMDNKNCPSLALAG
ncbi:hypothetical protein [Profundibacter sp.]|uniref:hypothetical protein n=1 Tax=Profundibacter sp. TaxID=3101071 RepID=UPI003D12DA63